MLLRPARSGLSSIQMIGASPSIFVVHQPICTRRARSGVGRVGPAESDRRLPRAIAGGLSGEALRHRVRAHQLGAEAVREQVAQVVRLGVVRRRRQ